MNDKHHSSLTQYLNDMLALERDIANAVRGQLEDERITAVPGLAGILGEIASGSESRIDRLKAMSESEGGALGAALKETVTAVAGTLAGLYGKVREHPVARMVRDDVVALHLSATSYSMLLTLGLAIGHNGCAALAEEGLRATAKLVMQLTKLLPLVVAGDLAEDAPLSNPNATQLATDKVVEAWTA
jgi:hypothetical protein